MDRLSCDLGQGRALALFTNRGIGLESSQHASSPNISQSFWPWRGILQKKGSADLDLTEQLWQPKERKEGTHTSPAWPQCQGALLGPCSNFCSSSLCLLESPRTRQPARCVTTQFTKLSVTQLSFRLTVCLCAADGSESGSRAPSEVKSVLPFGTDSWLRHRSRTLPHAGGRHGPFVRPSLDKSPRHK